MKRFLLAVVALFISSSAFAVIDLQADNNPDGSRTIIHNSEEWQFVVKAATYKVFVDKSIVNTKTKEVEFHSVTEFDGVQEYPNFPYKIKRIYSHGVLSCGEARLYLLADLFTDVDNVIRYSQSHDFGTYVTSLDVPKSIAKDVYDVVCGDTI